jgi:hypothetical protein
VVGFDRMQGLTNFLIDRHIHVKQTQETHRPGLVWCVLAMRSEACVVVWWFTSILQPWHLIGSIRTDRGRQMAYSCKYMRQMFPCKILNRIESQHGIILHSHDQGWKLKSAVTSYKNLTACN